MVKLRVGVLFFLLSSSFLFAGGAVLDSIVPGHPLNPGDSLVSSSGRFALGFFAPSGAPNSTGGGGLYVGIWYNKIPIQTVVWVANRWNPVTSTTNATFSISIQGTLSISDNSSSAVWSAEIQGLTSPAARLLDDGNLVVLDSSSPAPASGGGAGNTSSSAYAWQSFDDPTDTLLPGMKLGLSGGSNLNLTSWSSTGDPSPGEFTLSIDLRGDPQMALWNAAGGSPARLWRSGPWTGTQFSGMGPETHNYDSGFVFDFVHDARDVYYSYGVSDSSVVSRFLIDSTGVTQQLVWIDGGSSGNGSWSVFWYTPKTQCDKYAPCGPYGLCDPNGSPPCSCLPGFVPRSPADWDLRDGSGGCVRKTKLDCGRINGSTDGFATMGGTTLPDTVDVAAVDRGIDLGECGRRCSANCSCTGYANADVRDGGSGCIMWVGTLIDIHVAGGNVAGSQEFFYRLAAADLVAYAQETRWHPFLSHHILLVPLHRRHRRRPRFNRPRPSPDARRVPRLLRRPLRTRLLHPFRRLQLQWRRQPLRRHMVQQNPRPNSRLGRQSPESGYEHHQRHPLHLDPRNPHHLRQLVGRLVTEIQGLTSPAARLLDDGNLLVVEASSPAPASGDGNPSTYAWQSFDNPTDTLLPGMKLGLAGGLNLNLTSWRSAGDSSPGEFTLSMDLRGDPQMALWDAGSSSRLWRSGPWTGSDFSGLPETETYTGFVFGFVDNVDEVYYSYGVSESPGW